jgi:hypothetical protein
VVLSLEGVSIIWKKGVPAAPPLPEANIPTYLAFKKQVDRRKRQYLFLLSLNSTRATNYV